MGKSTQKTIGNNSKIRFILLEADLNDGDLSQITQAISNALGKSAGPANRPIASLGPVTLNGKSEEVPTGTDDHLDLEEEPETAAAPKKSTATKKYAVPKVLADVDLNSGDVPFETFATQKAPDKDVTRHLLVAYWFKQYRNVTAVSIDHAYTCYKKMKWGTAIKDFSKPFYNLSTGGRGEMKGGLFTINHIGEDVIDKLSKKGE